ncbi:MAG: hypothetical protein G3M78_03200 [Candidatus Nitrohelix vancouverensis]|uniref:Uncharacterized protein n=1 Tax=Candidatus Nitrohelix vancouverensis TaxID=2705534 RepID=A0A7T0G2K7_9BACT|nr:MAG: hypothetical protein G3M78_03200 [Candidatus Nitrohelix vancouverensis]
MSTEPENKAENTPANPEGEAITAEEAQEQQIDLNLIFPDEERDLNALFPDEESRQLLKHITKNKKDLNTLKERFKEENNLEEEEEEDSEETETDNASD